MPQKMVSFLTMLQVRGFKIGRTAVKVGVKRILNCIKVIFILKSSNGVGIGIITLELKLVNKRLMGLDTLMTKLLHQHNFQNFGRDPPQDASQNI